MNHYELGADPSTAAVPTEAAAVEPFDETYMHGTVVEPAIAEVAADGTMASEVAANDGPTDQTQPRLVDVRIVHQPAATVMEAARRRVKQMYAEIEQAEAVMLLRP